MTDRSDFDFDRSVATVEGSNVANYLLRELMEAMGEPITARSETPEQVWCSMLATIRGVFLEEAEA